MYQVTKRDGQVVDFEISKISDAITKAFVAIEKQYHPSIDTQMWQRPISFTASSVRRYVT